MSKNDSAVGRQSEAGLAKLTVLNPPLRFGIVEPGIFRTDVPKLPNFPYIRRLGLRTALLLTPEKPLRELVEFFREANVQMIHLGLTAWQSRDWRPVSDELIKEAIEVIMDPKTRPVAIMCSSGVNQTGVVVGCLRRLQMWSVNSCLNEYRRFARSKSRETSELYIELFDPDLVSVSPQQLDSFRSQTNKNCLPLTS